MFILMIICVLVLQITTATLDPKTLPVIKKKLFVPPLEEIAEKLRLGLKEYFREIEVKVVDCPDLTQPPFTLANVGLHGNAQLVAIGGIQYLFPLPDFTREYDIRHILEILQLKSGFIIGPCDVSTAATGGNGQGIVNINIVNDKIVQETRYVVVQKDGLYVTKLLPKNETRFDRYADYFVSEGNPGPVLFIQARKRIGAYSFTMSIRNTLAKHYKNKTVGLGGTFLIRNGKVLQHLLPDFQQNPLITDAQIDNWAKFYNMSTPLVAVGTLVTDRYGMDLRDEHFHTFSNHNDGGHYHNDLTPDTIEYLGYFNTAETVYRVDKPKSLLNVLVH